MNMKPTRKAKDTERDGGTRYPGASVVAFAGTLARRISRNAKRFVVRYATRTPARYSSHPLEFPPIRRAPYLGMQAGVLLLGTAMSMLAYAPLPAGATDETNEVVNIWKTEASPHFGLDGTNLIWDIHTRNNSNILPEGTPYNGNCIQVRLFDLYLSSEPTFEDVSGWNPTILPGSETNLYNITLDSLSSLDEIKPGEGEKKTFQIITYLPSTNHIPVLGTINGDGAIQGKGYFPDDRDDFTGPVGSIEKIIGENGSITNSPYFHEGSNSTFYIEADTHYRISDIKTNNTSIGSIPNNLSQTNYVWQVPKSGSIEAGFVLKDYTLTVVSEYPAWGLTNVGAPAPGTRAYEALSTATQSVDRIVVDPVNPGRRLRATGAVVE